MLMKVYMIENEEALERFKQFCIDQNRLRNEVKRLEIGSLSYLDMTWEIIDYGCDSSHPWYSIALGFFVAIGCTCRQAHELAQESKYTYAYWTNQ